MPSRAAAILVALQGLFLVIIGLVLAVNSVTGGPADRLGAQLGAGLAVAAGLTVLVLARALQRRRPWARSPVLVVELLCLPVAWGLFQAHRTVVGFVVAGAAVLGIGLLGASAAARADARPTRR